MRLRDKTNIDICEENNLKHTFLTNTVEEANTKAKIRATMQIISKTLCGTLGPYGSTTVIQDREMQHFATKDGYDVMNKISFDDELARTVLDILRQVASNQVLSVGDGSTSSIVVAEALYSALTSEANKELFSKVAPKDIIDILNDLSDILEEELKKQAKPVSKDFKEIETVAAIATNNDKETGELIREIYQQIGEYGFISTDILEKKEKNTYEVKQGIEWQRGYLDDYFAYGRDNKKIIHDQEPRIFITNSTLTYDDLEILLSNIVGDVCGKEKAELIIVANNYDEDVKTFLKTNRTKHLARKGIEEMLFTAVDIDQVTAMSVNTIKDLAVLVGVEVYDKFEHKPVDYLANPKRFVGRIEKAIITSKNTQIIGTDLSGEALRKKEEALTEYRAKVVELSNKDNLTSDEEWNFYEYKRRISSLTNSTAIIHVGGKSLTERRTKERLIEDAIYATKSALKYGVIPGGNIMIPKIIGSSKIEGFFVNKYRYIQSKDLTSFFRQFLGIIEGAFMESYANVLNNSYLSDEQIVKVIQRVYKDEFYNLKTHKFEKLKETTVINSVDTDIQILRSVISIVGILATSNQFITLNFNTRDQVR